MSCSCHGSSSSRRAAPAAGTTAHGVPCPSAHQQVHSSRGRAGRSRCLHVAAAAATLEQEVLREDPVLRQKKELQQMMDRDYKVG